MQPCSQLDLDPAFCSDTSKASGTLNCGPMQHVSSPLSSDWEDRCREALTPRPQRSAEATTAWHSDQVVPSNGLARSSFGAASPARTPSHASSVCSQPSHQQGLGQGWEMHRELLTKRAEHQHGPQSSPSQTPISVSLKSSAQPSASPARQRLDSCQFPASQTPRRHVITIQRRQDPLRKLPERDLTYQLYDGSLLRQEDRRLSATQTSGRKLSAQSLQRLPASPRKLSSYPEYKGLKRGREFHTLDPQSLQPGSEVEPCSNAPISASAPFRQVTHEASRPASSSQPESWQHQGPLLFAQQGRASRERLQRHSLSDSVLHGVPVAPRPGSLQGPMSGKVALGKGGVDRHEAFEGFRRLIKLPDNMVQLKARPDGSNAARALQKANQTLVSP